MRELTDDELVKREERRSGFDDFLAERFHVLADFADRLELPDPESIVEDPERFMDQIDGFMKDQVIKSDDMPWILARLGYFFGEVLIQRHGGCWLLNEDADSRSFLKYVVGQFLRLNNAQAIVDPFEAAKVYLARLPGVSLRTALSGISEELEASVAR